MCVPDPPVQIQFDSSYFRSKKEILKAIHIIVILVGYISMLLSMTRYHSYGILFTIVAIFGFWFSGIMLVLYLFHAVERFNQFPWLELECVFCALWTILYTVASSLVLTLHYYAAANIVAGIFGLIAMGLYGYEVYLKIQSYLSKSHP